MSIFIIKIYTLSLSIFHLYIFFYIYSKGKRKKNYFSYRVDVSSIFKKQYSGISLVHYHIYHIMFCCCYFNEVAKTNPKFVIKGECLCKREPDNSGFFEVTKCCIT